jgi:PAS domain S-box-containing protein
MQTNSALMAEPQDDVNILLVDDQPNNLLALDAMLSDMGTLVKADSGRKALKNLLDNDFAVILLDVQMPDLDGFETANLIREREKSRDTPIIFLTALSRSETNIYKGYSLGAVDYLFKPFNPEILRSKVSVFVELFRKNQALRWQTHELARLSKQNDLILKSAAEGVFGVDLAGRSTFVNPAAARMIGRRLEELTGREIHSILHSDARGHLLCDPEECPLYSALHGDYVQDQSETSFSGVDGSEFPVEYSATPMHDEEGNPIGSVITFRDVTEKRAAAQAQENERRYREAEAANRAKDNFLATLSHELRTPMTSILGWVQLIRCGGYDEAELQEALETIETSARLQARLIDDMLDVSRIVLGKFQVDLRPTRLSEVVEAALVTARPAAGQREVRLVSTIDTSDVSVEADASRLQQVISNILSNAIKFSEAGQQVELRLDRLSDEMKISVTDQGEGIDPGFLPHVFERLRQADGANNRSGLGLGLAIARHIIDLHGGRITAESPGLGKGARFTVFLPIATQSPIEAPNEQNVVNA